MIVTSICSETEELLWHGIGISERKMPYDTVAVADFFSLQAEPLQELLAAARSVDESEICKGKRKKIEMEE